ncbi:staphostatin A, partial [Staphylococcus aureus]
MSKYQLINIKDNNLEFSEKYWLHILQGVWRPEKISTKPLKITFNKNIFPIYICKEINEDSRRIISSTYFFTKYSRISSVIKS